MVLHSDPFLFVVLPPIERFYRLLPKLILFLIFESLSLKLRVTKLFCISFGLLENLVNFVLPDLIVDEPQFVEGDFGFFHGSARVE